MREYKIIKSLWGMGGSLDCQLAQIKKTGYDGVECVPFKGEAEKEFLNLLKKYELVYIAQIHTVGPDHFESFVELLEQALVFSPVLINSHTGRDTMGIKERNEFFEKVLKYEEKVSVPVAHETHRTRTTFSPMATLDMVHTFPSLKLTADFSHWCCVCESLLEDQAESIAEIILHVLHIHGRVGYRQGPQVPDPAAPEYAQELAAHEAWWKAICRELWKKSTPVTFVPEYGPDFSRYMHTLPYTDQPVADLWKVCLWGADRFRSQIVSI
jgi:hypothetical protein